MRYLYALLLVAAVCNSADAQVLTLELGLSGDGTSVAGTLSPPTWTTGEDFGVLVVSTGPDGDLRDPASGRFLVYVEGPDGKTVEWPLSVGRHTVTTADLKGKGYTTPEEIVGLGLGVVVEAVDGQPRILHKAGKIPSLPVPERTRDASEEEVSPTEVLSKGESNLQKLRAESREYLSDEGITGHRRDRGPFGDKWHLYHLADGSLAFPAPFHLSEEDEVKLIVVAPIDAEVAFEVLACGSVPSIRVLGDLETVRGLLASEQDGLHSGVAYEEKPCEVDLQCAEALAYKITVRSPQAGPLATATRTIPIDPIYRFSWSVGYGFDLGTRDDFGLVERPAEDGATERVVQRRDDYHGSHGLVALKLHPFGANPNDWKKRDVFTPFFALDPDRIDEGFIVGLGLTPFWGFDLLVAWSVFEQERVPRQLGLADGDLWEGSGDLPVERYYGAGSNGATIGVSFTAAVFRALLGSS